MVFLLSLIAGLAVGPVIQAASPNARDQFIHAAENGQFLTHYYPEGAAKRGEQGRVGFRIAIEREGWVGSCEVTESSGFRALDRETCEIMVQYARVKPVRSPSGMPIRAIQSGYINWKLPAGVKLATPAVVTEKPNPILCRRDNMAGSLVRKTIQCLTRSEWELQQGFTQDTWHELQGKGHTGNGG